MERISSPFQSSLAFPDSSGVRSLQLKNGQLIMGKVAELYPNQRALLQFGPHKLTAAVEAPLQKGGEYIFQAAVRSQSDLPELKLIEKMEKQADPIRALISIAPPAGAFSSKWASQAAVSLLRASIPFSAEDISEAAEWLKSLTPASKEAGVLAVQEAMERQLPINRRTLSSVLEAVQGGSIKSGLQNLVPALSISDPKEAALLQKIDNLWNGTADRKASAVIHELQKLSTGSFTEEKAAADSVLTKLSASGNPAEQLRQMFQSNSGILTAEEMNWIGQKIKIRDVLSQPKELIRLFMLLEKSFSAEGGENRSEQTIRSLLAQVGDSASPAADHAEKLSLKLNGLQLLQNDQPGQLSLWQHFPVQDERILSDVAVNFQLRKDPKGEIDPAFCRLVFYLDLKHLGPLTADVQIQNRVVSAAVYSKQDLSSIAAAAHSELKAGFSGLPYQFSGISFKKTEEWNVPEAPVYQAPSKGFDFRI
ncbi:hypothetical protein CEF21_11780 [Bacillus sp. FJAT-42376]|uniref:hypothetical protein n=1 Tax=Bacillus sp. FJAT-42376 TaxID=2014076 RepID=UPI000F4D3BDE|nr:hypothetical protein [Bacillus sp. FJAT-42376]AZB42923.1 hypothetical protein CEF21_11780 [Bacillus sp. FJAT-42376]